MRQRENDDTRGRIVVVCGCMFAGKTARLIHRLQTAADAGRRVVACKHRLDARYDPDRLVTHDGREFDAVAVSDGREIAALAAKADVLGIDEAQFFGRTLAGVCDGLARAGHDIIVAGIDNDAWGQPFPPLPELKTLANEVELLCAPCTKCGEPARYSQRMVPVREGFMVGGLSEYEPRCEACFKPLPAPAPVY